MQALLGVSSFCLCSLQRRFVGVGCSARHLMRSWAAVTTLTTEQTSVPWTWSSVPWAVPRRLHRFSARSRRQLLAARCKLAHCCSHICSPPLPKLGLLANCMECLWQAHRDTLTVLRTCSACCAQTQRRVGSGQRLHSSITLELWKLVPGTSSHAGRSLNFPLEQCS